MKISASKIKKNIIIGISAVVLVFLGIIIWALLQKEKVPTQKEIAPIAPKEETQKGAVPKEVIKNLTAPSAATETEVPEEVIKNLTAPKNKKPSTVPKEVLDSLTAPK